LLIASAAPARQAADNTTWTTMQQRGSIIAGVKFDAPPFGSVAASGEVSGFEIDLLREFASRWLGDPDAVEFVQVTSSNRIDRLLSGDIDLIAATMTINPARAQQIDFSQVYFLDGQNILVNTDRLPLRGDDTARLQTLDGATIAAIQGSTSIDRIQQYAIEHSITITVAEFEQYDQAVQPLLDGRVDGLTTDRGILTGLAQQHPELAILLDQNFSEEPYGMAVRPGDVTLLAQINQTLQALAVDGTYNQIYARWFPAQPPFALAVTPAAATPTTAASTATPSAPLQAAATASPEPTATVALPPTATNVPAATATLAAELAPTPTTLPVTGFSPHNVSILAWIGLITLLLLGAVIYRRYKRA